MQIFQNSIDREKDSVKPNAMKKLAKKASKPIATFNIFYKSFRVFQIKTNRTRMS